MRGDEFFEEIAARPPLTKLHPRVASFLKNYLAGEKVIPFEGRRVINTQFPPYPGRAFESLLDHFLGDGARRLYSVTLAVTNRCRFRCWHCYNAGRSRKDLPLDVLRRLAAELQDRGAVVVTLTGGEPLLRKDLPDICRSFDDRSCLVVGTTGEGLTERRAHELKECGVFAVGISLDSVDPAEHNGRRGRKDAYKIALNALAAAGAAGLYPYVVSVATREFLERGRFFGFLWHAREAGALEVHLLEPCPTGRLAGRGDVVLKPSERRRIVEYQREVARREDLPVLSTFAYLEGKDAFGCGAGLTHIYVDGSGELCPCNLVPLSFGNVAREPLDGILDRMGRHFVRPRPSCVGRLLTRFTDGGPLPVGPKESASICEAHLPVRHSLPLFFRTRQACGPSAGNPELADAYDRVHADYDEFWLSAAAGPVKELVAEMGLKGTETVFEAGCGSGFGTALLARKLRRGGRVVAADISGSMLAAARGRLAGRGLANAEFLQQDAVDALSRLRGLDAVFTSWVLGYIPLRPFFTAAAQALSPGGRLALIVHRENSPRQEFEIFSSLIARNPLVMTRRVAFDFPRDGAHLESLVDEAGLAVVKLWEGSAVFRYETAGAVLDHLLKSGAGTVFYDAIDRSFRDGLTREFLEILQARNGGRKAFRVRHDYVACIAERRGVPAKSRAAAGPDRAVRKPAPAAGRRQK
jgi:MoaA/NifB/PqqE/SkfB family radical SAM enzyme/SAM-dependent methyltransferase